VDPLVWMAVLFVYLLVGAVLVGRFSERDRGLALPTERIEVASLLAWPFVLAMRGVFRLPEPPTAPGKPGGFQPGRLPPAGVAVSDLCPAGAVEVAGRRYSALAEGGPVQAGKPVQIVGRAGRALRVRGCPADQPGPG
jgi:membrane-bound ClpP family serine protease